MVRDVDTSRCSENVIRPNKKISVFPATGLKLLGRVGTHILFYFFSSKNLQLYE